MKNIRLARSSGQSDLRKDALDDAKYADFENTCGVTVYVHIEWPAGGETNFQLGPGEFHSLFIGTGGDPVACFSTDGLPRSCDASATLVSAGNSYTTC